MGDPEGSPDVADEAVRGEDRGGDAVCWLDRVCPECGALRDAEPPAPCPRCGSRTAPA